jgi:hypothetical protein
MSARQSEHTDMSGLMLVISSEILPLAIIEKSENWIASTFLTDILSILECSGAFVFISSIKFSRLFVSVLTKMKTPLGNGKPVNKRSEPDPLNKTFYTDAICIHLTRMIIVVI